MREIKFRGWNKRSKIMVDDIKLFAPGSTYNLNDAFDPDMIVLPLQYTGLKDKNGKEIYEGDIILALHQDDWYKGKIVKHYTRRSRYIVEWCERSSGFSFAERLGGEWTANVTGFSYIQYHSTNTAEVIGNIYENPDLRN